MGGSHTEPVSLKCQKVSEESLSNLMAFLKKLSHLDDTKTLVLAQTEADTFSIIQQLTSYWTSKHSVPFQEHHSSSLCPKSKKFPSQINYLVPCSNSNIQNTTKESKKKNPQTGCFGVSHYHHQKNSEVYVPPDQHLSFISALIPINFSTAFSKTTTI